MPATLNPVEPREQDALIRFLVAAFGLPSDSPFVDAGLMHWKYFAPLPGWSGPRSWVMKEGEERIVAHVGIWPIRLAGPNGLIDCVHLIDWGADPTSPGAGVQIYTEMLHRHTAALVLGGSATARKLLGRMGFHQLGSLDGYVRVVRPWKQFFRRPERDLFRDSGKLARNLAWSLAGGSVANRAWSSEPVASFSDSLDALFSDAHENASPGQHYTRSHRSSAALNYLLTCPGMKCRGFLLHFHGQLRGYFLIVSAFGQSRLADLRILNEQDQDLQDVLPLVIAAATAPSETCEFLVSSSTAFGSSILQQMGFRLRSQKPIWLYDPTSALGSSPRLQIRAADSDAFFLFDRRNPFLT